MTTTMEPRPKGVQEAEQKRALCVCGHEREKSHNEDPDASWPCVGDGFGCPCDGFQQAGAK